jgi:hypothetical protein
MRRYMILANQTLGGDELVQFVRDRAAEDECEFRVVVPAHPEEGRRLAGEQLKGSLKRLTDAGLPAEGQIGDPDPMVAVEEALGRWQVDEIVVATLPPRLSRWMHQDLPRRLEQRFGLPVTHVGVTKVSRR